MMCGRYTLTSPVESLRELFGFLELPNLPPRCNVAPTQEVLAVRLSQEGRPEAAHFRWGLLPSWAKDRGMASRMINARAEGVADKPAFRAAFRARRCLLPADGFYEWRAEGKGPKQPFHIVRRDGKPMAFAGLWERWRDPAQPSAPPLETCTIVTTEANATVKPLHDRMPVILEPQDFAAWLDPASPRERLAGLLKPAPDDSLRAYPVSRRVNAVANDDLALIAPLPETRQGELL